MDENKNLRQIENQVKEIKEKLWKVEKNLGLPTDDLYIYRLLKILEERVNVIEMMLKIGDYNE